MTAYTNYSRNGRKVLALFNIVMAHIVEGEDRISKLPVHIIHHHILPLISNAAQARLCILSKAWNRIWRSRPNVIIWQSRHKMSLGVESFVKYVDDTLRPYVEQNLSIEKFSLQGLEHPELACHVDRWLSLLIELNVRSLYIDTYRYIYSIPDAILAARKLTVISLWGCDLGIDNSTTTNKLQRLINTCSLIRDLRVRHCQGITNLHVSGLVNLKRLEVNMCKGLEKLEIQAPNLRIFKFVGARLKPKTRYEVEPLPCSIDILDGYNTIKILILEATTMTGQQFEYLMSKLSALEKLTLQSCCQMKIIKIVSEKLKRFTLWQWINLEKVSMLHTPNLKKFDFFGHKMPFSTMDPSNLEHAELEFVDPPDLNSSFGDVDTNWCNNLQDFVQKFSYSKGLILVIHCKEEERKSVLIYEDPREILVPPTRELVISVINPSRCLESFVHRLIKYTKTIFIVPRVDSKMVQVFHEKIRHKENQYRRPNEVTNHEGANDQNSRTSCLYRWLKSTSLIDRIITFYA